jgi:DNA-binding response OmpR family regulator
MSHSERSRDCDPASHGSVLIFDDHDQLRQMLALELETAGFDVFEAGTQLELLRRLAVTRPDALIFDLQRAEADGLTLLARMRALPTLHDVPILFLSGYDDDEFRWQAMRAGADWFGLRPLAMIELHNAIGTLIRTGRPAAPGEWLPRPPTPIRRLTRTG